MEYRNNRLKFKVKMCIERLWMLSLSTLGMDFFNKRGRDDARGDCDNSNPNQ